MTRFIVTVYSVEHGPIIVDVPDHPEKTYVAGIRDGILAYLKATQPDYEFRRLTREIDTT